MRHTHGPGGWRSFLRWLLPGRGATPTRITPQWGESPRGGSVYASGTGSVAVGGDSHAPIRTRASAAGARPTRDRSGTAYRAGRSSGSRPAYDPVVDPASPTHQAIYGGPFWGAGRADSAASTSDCADRTPSHDSPTSYGGGHSSHDSGGSSSSYGGGSSSSYDGGGSCSSGGDSGGSW